MLQSHVVLRCKEAPEIIRHEGKGSDYPACLLKNALFFSQRVCRARIKLRLHIKRGAQIKMKINKLQRGFFCFVLADLSFFTLLDTLSLCKPCLFFLSLGFLNKEEEKEK